MLTTLTVSVCLSGRAKENNRCQLNVKPRRSYLQSQDGPGQPVTWRGQNSRGSFPLLAMLSVALAVDDHIQANFVLVCTRPRQTPGIVLYNTELTWYFHPRWLLSCFDILTKLTLNKHCRNHRTRPCPPLAQDSPQIRCNEHKMLDPLSQECPILTKDFKATSC